MIRLMKNDILIHKARIEKPYIDRTNKGAIMKKKILILILFFMVVTICLAAVVFAYADQSEILIPSFGDRVFFGHYEQDGDPATVPEEIRWIVLDVRDDKVLLLSDMVLESRSFNRGRDTVSWETSELREWLNSKFLDTAFSEEEKTAIPSVELDNSESPIRLNENEIGYQKPTTDRVFLLSYSEYKSYLAERRLGYAKATEYAKNQGIRTDITNKDMADKWWLRTTWKSQDDKNPDDVATSSSDTLASFDFIGVRPAIWADLHSDAFVSAMSKSVGPIPSFSWKGYSLTPMFYDKYVSNYFPTIHLRIACEDIPLELLYNERENFQILDKDGAELLRSFNVIVMENELQPYMLQGTADFFDVVFPYEKSSYELIRNGWLKAGDDAEKIHLPMSAEENPLRCAFVTHDGLYVIYLISAETDRWLFEPFQDAFDHKDIRMCLSGYSNNSQQSYFLPTLFLENYEFSSLDLTLSHDLGLKSDWDKSGALKRVSAVKISSGAEFPSVASLTYCFSGEGDRFPKFESVFPNLEELILLFNGEDNDADFLDEYKDLLSSTCNHLKALTIIGPDESTLPTDKEFRYWLDNQCAAAPEMTINGKKAAAFLETDDEGFYQDYKELIRIFESAEKLPSVSHSLSADLFGKKNLFCITNEDPKNISSTNTNPDKTIFSSIPEQLLAGSLQEADTIVRIFPDIRKVGSYVNSSTNQKITDAYAIDTYVEVYTRLEEDWFLSARMSVYTSNPPGYDFSINGSYAFTNMPQSNTGAFMPERAIEQICSFLADSESLE